MWLDIVEHCISRGNNKILLIVFFVTIEKKTRGPTAQKLGVTLHEDNIKMRTENKVSLLFFLYVDAPSRKPEFQFSSGNNL